MSVWLSLGLVIIGLIAVASVVLVTDIARGDIGGGAHTMARARRILVVATDEETTNHAEQWIERQHAERPDMQYFVLTEPEGQGLFVAIEGVLDRERPDAIVMARHWAERHDSYRGTFGRLKDELRVPVDAIFVGEEA